MMKKGDKTTKEFVYPFGVGVSSDGSVFVSDEGAQEIKKFDPTGKFILKWGGWGSEAGQFYKPKSIAIDNKDRVFVVDFGNHRGQIFTAEGDFLAMFGIGEAAFIGPSE